MFASLLPSRGPQGGDESKWLFNAYFYRLRRAIVSKGGGGLKANKVCQVCALALVSG